MWTALTSQKWERVGKNSHIIIFFFFLILYEHLQVLDSEGSHIFVKHFQNTWTTCAV